MKVFIVGLGLMGASYATKLTQVGYDVFGLDKDIDTVNTALKDGVIKGSNLEDLKTADLVILALYPNKIVEFVKDNLSYFDKQLITDLSGTKTKLLGEVLSILPKNIRYVSHHPMAGKEKSGYMHRNTEMFLPANFLIIDSNHANDEDVDVLKRLAKDLGFKKWIVISAKAHDELIAHTSQLTHLLAVGLMLMNDSDITKDATGDSFRDLTRIANINESMWTELFLENKIALLEKIDKFQNVLTSLKEDIQNEDSKLLKEKLKSARERRLEFK